MQTLNMTMTPGFDHLAWGVRTGGGIFERAHPQGLWKWLEEDPQRHHIFNCGMAETGKAGGFRAT